MNKPDLRAFFILRQIGRQIAFEAANPNTKVNDHLGPENSNTEFVLP
jgi:hypothetical protein